MATSQQATASSTPPPRSFATYGFEIAEYAEHLKKRQCDNRVVVQQPLWLLDSNNTPCQAAPGEQLYLKTFSAQSNTVTFGRLATNSICTARATDIEVYTAPHILSLRSVLAGNRRLVNATFKKEKAREKERPNRGTSDVTFVPTSVRTVTSSTTIRTIDGEMEKLMEGDQLDVGPGHEPPSEICVVRSGTERMKYAVVARDELEQFTEKAIDRPRTKNAVEGLVLTDTEDRQYFLVIHDFDALGERAKKLPISRGQVIFMRWTKREKIGWCVDSHGRSFILDLSRIFKLMEEIQAEALVLERSPNYTGLSLPSRHTLHNDRVTPGLPLLPFEGQTEEDAFEDAGMEIYATSCQGLPLPPSHWVPKGGPGMIDKDYRCWTLANAEDYLLGKLTVHSTVALLDQNFGFWVFERVYDYCLALEYGFHSAQDVVLAAFLGMPGLQDIVISWRSGAWDPVRAPSGSAYFHILEIEHRRNFWFGRQGRTNATEVPVYTGTDPFAHERRGATNDILDSMALKPAKDATAALPTEQMINQQILDRQGFLARSFPLPATSLQPNTTPRARQMQEAVLRASDRRVELWRPFKSQHPIDPVAPLDLRTSYHPEYAHMKREELMHDSNYLLYRHQDIRAEIYQNNHRSWAILSIHLALLNESGEVLRTLVHTAPKIVQEVTVEDYPFLPHHIAADEDPALLHTFSEFCPDNKQIAARMDEQQRKLWAFVNNDLCYLRWDVRLNRENQCASKFAGKKAFDKRVRDRPTAQAHSVNNTLRGVASGKIDPNLEKEAVVTDVAGVTGRNWIEFPSTTTHPSRKLKTFHRNIREEMLVERKRMVEEQSKET